jgi:predicted transcriptional regulator of viral defense system
LKQATLSHAMEIFRQRGGILHTKQAMQAGISPRTLYALRDGGWLIMLSRGLFRLADAPPLEQPDLVQVALAIPKGVICLISALSFHNLTTQIPHQVYLALPVDAEKPRLAYPPIRLFWLSGKVYSSGIEFHELDHVKVRVYGREKTIADCFKFRNKIGTDIAREALREGLRQGCKVDKLLEFARTGRVENVMRPFMEAML